MLGLCSINPGPGVGLAFLVLLLHWLHLYLCLGVLASRVLFKDGFMCLLLIPFPGCKNLLLP